MMKKSQAVQKSLEIIEEKGDTLKVRFQGYSGYFVNAIRRKIINSVEVCAVDEIEIIKNTSGLYDEMLAHRLALIPFTFDKKVLLSKQSKECRENPESPRCKVKFYLKSTGPAKVYAKSIKTTHEAFKPLYDDILIVRLLEDQEIELEGSLVLGCGKEHAKFIPAIVGFKEIEEDNIYELTIESISSLSPKEILKEALHKMEIEIKELDKLFK